MKTVLFDLDGTLTDSAPGIIAGIRYALGQSGYEQPTMESLYSFLGPPMKEQFCSFLGVDPQEAQRLIGLYRSYYSERGLFENAPFEGVENMLASLKEKGVRIALATSKPEQYAEQILCHFHMDGYFDLIGGALLHERRKKEEVIEYVLQSLSLLPGKDIIMVGDRKYDILAANDIGLTSIGVLYGYGSAEELRQCEPDYMAETVDDLKNMLFAI